MNTYEIEPTKKVLYPRSMIFFDTESFIHDVHIGKNKGKKTKDQTREKHTLRLGVAIYLRVDKDGNELERYSFRFKTALEFWLFVKAHSNKDSSLYVYAHNIKYDLANVDVIRTLRELMLKESWDVPYPVISHNFIMTCRKDPKPPKIKENGKPGKIQYKHRIYFLDTFNYVQTSLAKIGEKLGHPKMEVDLKTEDENELFRYCQNDVEIVEKFILSFISFLRTNNLGSLKFTLASTAFNVWRHALMEETIYYHDNVELLKQERAAYRGGRVECFVIGKPAENPHNNYIFYLDVNSMYPYVMANKKLPLRPFMREKKISVNALKIIVGRCYTVADVLIEDNNPFNPYGLKFDGLLDGQKMNNLIFPKGQFRITLHQAELEYALKNNSVKDVYGLICYDSAIALKSYVDFFYQMKKSATNPVDYELAKILMNSLYGRFALREYDTEVLKLTDEMDFFEEIDEEFNFAGSWSLEINGQIQTYYHWMDSLVRGYADEFIPVKNTSVALAGAVTAYARMLLYEYAQVAGQGNVFYCDTDSLMVSSDGYRNLLPYIDESQLGLLKLEGIADIDDFLILAPKNYHFGDKHRSKGIPKSAVLTEDGKYEYWHFTTFKDYLRNGADFKGRVKVIKQNRLEYHKGTVDENGLVSAFKMGYRNGENIVLS